MTNDFIICVASEDEKKALIPEKYYDKVIITGIGIANTMLTIFKENLCATDKRVINVGYAGANKIPIGTVCMVEENLGYQVNCPVNLFKRRFDLDGLNIPKYKCYTSTDFVNVSPIQDSFLVDMELLALSTVIGDLYSIKIVSDNMSLDDYNNSLKSDYTEEIEKALHMLGVE